MTVDEHLLPSTGEEPVSGIFDLRDNPTLEGRGFDDAWTDITNRGEDGSTSAAFTRPDGIKVTLTGDKTINSWQVCTGNEIGEKARQAGVAVEPMTAYADAFRTGKDLVCALSRMMTTPPWSPSTPNKSEKPSLTIIATWTPVLHHVVLMWHNSEGLFFYCSKGVHHGHARHVSARIVVRKPPTTAKAPNA